MREEEKKRNVNACVCFPSFLLLRLTALRYGHNMFVHVSHLWAHSVCLSILISFCVCVRTISLPFLFPFYLPRFLLLLLSSICRHYAIIFISTQYESFSGGDGQILDRIVQTSNYTSANNTWSIKNKHLISRVAHPISCSSTQSPPLELNHSVKSISSGQSNWIGSKSCSIINVIGCTEFTHLHTLHCHRSAHTHIQKKDINKLR